MHSHHSHSGSFCAHAKGDLESVVLEAIRKGFKVYGLSEHVPRYRERDLYPEEASLSVPGLREAFDSYVKEALRLKDMYADQITLLVGLESDFITELDIQGLTNLLDRYSGSIDYMVGSIHHVNEIPIDFDRPTWETAVHSFDPFPNTVRVDLSPAAIKNYLSAYFDAQYMFMQRFHPEIVGHFDLCRLYLPSLRLDDPAYGDVWEKVQRNVEYAIAYGACFELNAAAFRKGWSSAYPGEEVLRLILSKQGRLVLSDDSHGPASVGLNYHLLFEYMLHMGVEDIWYLERCEELNVGGRKVKAARCMESWRRSQWWESVRPKA